MRRILSGLALLLAVTAAVWFLPPPQLLPVVLLVLGGAYVEYARLARLLGAPVPAAIAGTAAAAACLAVAWPAVPAEVPLVTAVIALAAQAIAERRMEPAVLHRIGASAFGILWLGLPLGTLVALRADAGRGALLLLLLTIVASDTAQYVVGTLFGRHRLAPALSPHKSVEGALGGFAAGIAVAVVGGRWGLPDVGAGWLAGLGAVVVACGILGDLFESLLKRSAGVKDTSRLIPGHGGMLDRIDALLFAAPVFWIAVRYIA